MNWVIHIGAQKTGSKAIQSFLANEADRIEAPRVLFPSHGRHGVWHRPMYESLLVGDASLVKLAVAERRHDGELGVLSYEGMVALPDDAVRLLRRNTGDARVVVFIRRQDEWTNSFLNQLVKAHRVGIDEIRRFEERITTYNPVLDYRRILSRWADSYGRDNVLPLLYDKRRDVVAQFCEAVGIRARGDTPSSASRNRALDWHSYNTLRALKQRRPTAEELPALVTEAHAELGARFIDTRASPGIQLIDDETRRSIMEIYADSNEWVRSTWFPGSSWPSRDY